MKRLFALLAMMCVAISVQAAVPPIISYQGKITGTDGKPVPDGLYTVRFAIYDVPTGGAPIWSETNTAVQLKGGLFSVLLGSVVNLPANVFDKPNRFFGIQFGTDPEMTPRQQIASVPFAWSAAHADTALKATQADAATLASTVSDGAVTTDKIADGAVTSVKLATDLSVAGSLNAGDIKGPWDKTDNNYIRIGDMQIAWGLSGWGEGPITVTMPAPFVNRAYAVVLTYEDWPAGVATLKSDHAKTTLSFIVNKYNIDGSAYKGAYMPFNWIAIGRWR